jgi:[NiFe] hydrogenase small subunit
MDDKKPFPDDGSRERRTSRRDFLKFCSAIAVAIGLGPAGARRVAAALLAGPRPSVLWLHFAECTACTESVLRTVSPYIDDLILDTISLDYHETILAGAGDSVHTRLYNAAAQNSGQFFAVVEGAIPTAMGGIFGTVGGKTMVQIAQDILPKAKAIICVGTCSSYGGIQAASPNPTGAKGVADAMPGLSVPLINIPGCPPNPISFVGVIANYLLTGTLPALDSIGRPLDFYGSRVHSLCPYQGDTVRCMIDKGCKGPISRNSCPDAGFNENTSFCMKAGHQCIGCSEPDFWDRMTSFYYKNYQDVAVEHGFEPPFTLAKQGGRTEIFDLRGRRVDIAATGSGAARALRNRQRTPGAYIMRSTEHIVRKIGF